ncbi:MAG: hypothetical protein M3A44_03840 [Gammaproteobacteria bacterium]
MDKSFSIATITQRILPARVDSCLQIVRPALQPINAAPALSPISDWDTVAQIISKQAPSLVTQGRYRTLESRLQRLPEGIVKENPWLLYWRAQCCFPRDLGQARAYFEQALVLFKARQDVAGMFSAWSGVMDSIMAERKDYTLLGNWTKVLDDLIITYPTLGSTDIEARVTASMLGALVLHQPHHPGIALWEARAQRLLQDDIDININQRIALGNHLLTFYLWRGHFDKAAQVANAIKPEAGKASPTAQMGWRVSEAMLGWFTRSAETCLEAVTEGLEKARVSGDQSADFHLHAQGAHGALLRGDVIAARGYLCAMSAMLDSTHRLDVSLHCFFLAWDSLCRNDFQSVVEQAQTALRLAAEGGMPVLEVLSHLMLAQGLLECNRRREALDHLACARDIGVAMKSSYLDFQCLLLDAQFSFMQQREERGLRTLRKALALGQRQGYRNVHGWRVCMMAMLCKKALENGIEVEYIRELIRSHDLQPPCPPLECENWPWAVKIYTLGRFSVVKEGKSLHTTSGKVHGKPLALLKALIAFGGREVCEAQLVDALWPDADGDAGRQVLRITLHRLRSMLGNDKTVQVKDGRITLDASYCWVDIWAFERLISQAETARPTLNSEKAHSLYQGHFLNKDIEYPWALSMRERLHSKFLRHLETRGRYWENAGEWEKAIDCYRKGLEVDALAEVFYQRLMACYQQQGRRAEAMVVYQRCRTALSTLMGVAPSPHVEAVRRALGNVC